MERNQIHKNQKGYSIWKGKLLKFLKKRNFTLSDIATKIGISERELQERLDDWDYWNAEEIERIVCSLFNQKVQELSEGGFLGRSFKSGDMRDTPEYLETYERRAIREINQRRKKT